MLGTPQRPSAQHVCRVGLAAKNLLIPHACVAEKGITPDVVLIPLAAVRPAELERKRTAFEMSCRICRNLLPSRALYNSKEDYRLEELLSSAQSCQLCSILLSTLQSYELEGIGKISIQDLLTGGYEMFVIFKGGVRNRVIRFYNLDSVYKRVNCKENESNDI
jgi:hypothetical protein